MLLHACGQAGCQGRLLLRRSEWWIFRQCVAPIANKRLNRSADRYTVDYMVTGPSKEPGKERVILEGEKERQGDYVFTATQSGEYRFCFDNSVSTFTDKLVDFEISVRERMLMI